MARIRLRLHGLAWERGGRRRVLRPDPLVAEAGQTAVVVADDPADVEAFTDVVLGLAWPIRGTIHLADREITTSTPLERGIGLVPAGGCLAPHLTVEQNIAFGLRRSRAGRRAHIGFVADRLKIGGLRLRPHQVSPDERLRVALARAVCGHSLPNAMVIEDRAGRHPCEAAVSSMRSYPDLPVLVVSDSDARGAALAAPSDRWKIVDADEP
ncbi:MAG TPA: ATP-binding cassette domain-containing protein [Thermopolyspora sp.]